MRNGVTVWFTGLSGAGKTTISRLVEKQLLEKQIPVETLDGDIVRQHLTPDLGYTMEDRYTNVRRSAYVAKLLTQHGVIVLASFISPYKKMREEARKAIGSFVEVYVNCPLEECIRRDVKGLYKKAQAGEILDFTGISAPFEEPDCPQLMLETDRHTPEQCADRLIHYLKMHGYI